MRTSQTWTYGKHTAMIANFAMSAIFHSNLSQMCESQWTQPYAMHSLCSLSLLFLTQIRVKYREFIDICWRFCSIAMEISTTWLWGLRTRGECHFIREKTLKIRNIAFKCVLSVANVVHSQVFSEHSYVFMCIYTAHSQRIRSTSANHSCVPVHCLTAVRAPKSVTLVVGARTQCQMKYFSKLLDFRLYIPQSHQYFHDQYSKLKIQCRKRFLEVYERYQVEFVLSWMLLV